MSIQQSTFGMWMLWPLFSPFPIQHRCTVQDAGWPADLSGWPDPKNAPDLCLLWSFELPVPFHGSSRAHICVYRHGKCTMFIKANKQSSWKTFIFKCLRCVRLTLGWHSVQSCTSSRVGPSSSTVGFWSSGYSLRCTEKASHLSGNSFFCSL